MLLSQQRRDVVSRENRRLVVRPELGTDAIHMVPAIAHTMFAAIPGSQLAETKAPRTNFGKATSIEAITGVPSLDGCTYDVPCNTTTKITFTINGEDYPIPPSQWVVPNDASDDDDCMCKTRIIVSKEPTFGDQLYDILLGTPFLRTVYSVYKYDAKQPLFGLAKLPIDVE